VDSASVHPFNTQVKPYIVMGPGAGKNGSDDFILSVNSDEDLTYYDCSRLFFQSAKYIVQDTVVRTADLAVRRIYDLKAAGVKANALWLGCFGNDNRYVVFPGLLHPNRRDAETSLRTYAETLKKAKMSSQLQIRSLTFIKK